MKDLLIILLAILITVGAKAELSEKNISQESDQSSGSPSDANPPASGPGNPVADPGPAPEVPQPAEPVSPQPAEPPVVAPPAEDPAPPVLEPEPLPIVIGEAGYGGSGCTAGNALVDHDEQGLITILLAPMTVSGESSVAPFARAACSVRIPILVPAHHKLAIVEVSNEGHYSVQPGDSLSLTQESGFVGANTAPQILDLKSDSSGDIKWDSSVGQLAESSCERTENVLLLNTNALLKKQKSSLTASELSLDSVSVQLMLEACED
jgi:hypothetical protein